MKNRKNRFLWTSNQLTPYSKLVERASILSGIDDLINCISPNISTSYYKFDIHGLSLDKKVNHNYITLRSLRGRILKKGHTDQNMWMFVNPMIIQSVRQNGWYSSVPYFAYQTENWVLDIDNKDGANSIEDILKILKETDTYQKTKAIVQTSKNGFHLLIEGVVGEWTFKNRILFAKKIARIKENDLPLSVLANLLKNEHIDVDHLHINPLFHKIRLPSSINRKTMTNLSNDVFICKYWINPTLSKKIPVKRKSKPVVRKSDLFYLPGTKRKVDFLEYQLASEFNQDDTELFAKIFGIGWYGFQKKGWRIYQKFWSKYTGLSQGTILNKVNILIKKDYIIEIKKHKVGAYAKTYKAGPELIKIFELFSERTKKWMHYNINSPYEKGKTHQHVLADIRYLAYRDESETQIVKFIYSKLQDRSEKSDITRQDIRSTCRNWMRKKGHFSKNLTDQHLVA